LPIARKWTGTSTCGQQDFDAQRDASREADAMFYQKAADAYGGRPRLPRLARRGGVTLDMPLACTHASHMSKMVQIRNVPDTLHRKLKVRAANSGQTLSDYLLAELVRLAARPTREEMLVRIHSRHRVTLKTPAAVVIREERESA
jgi:plasmid stability protein